MSGSRPRMLLEVADKIPHPPVIGFWICSALVGAGAVIMVTGTRRLWTGLVPACILGAATALWVLSFYFDGPGGISSQFRSEVGTGYFVHVMLASWTPCFLIAASRRSSSNRASGPSHQRTDLYGV